MNAPALGLLTCISFLCGCAGTPKDDGLPTSDAASPDIAVHEQGLLICELTGRDSIVRVFAGDGGTRYSLCDRVGNPIATNLDGDALTALRPDLDPRRLHADGSFDLMLTDQPD